MFEILVRMKTSKSLIPLQICNEVSTCMDYSERFLDTSIG